VDASISKQATLVVGGHIPDRTGYYYPPTLLIDVVPGMPAFDEELFGPVISVVKAKDKDHALELANLSTFGLSSAVFTQNMSLGEEFARQLNTGTCFVNAVVASDPRVPFGGIKQSGFGRELSREGILEFVNVKSIAIR
jgi:succinate-semialdehyde dehydrogenase/glutarate-semialdehyde dehydrogenase